MKKALLTFACLFIANPASAVVINDIVMDFYDATNVFIGYTSPASGVIDTSAKSGHLVGDVLFFGEIWSADVMWTAETAGQHTWSGCALTSTYGACTKFNYTFTLAAGDVAVGLYFDWAINNNIPILSVFHPNPDGTWSAVDQVWYKGTTTTPKHGLQTGPFPGQRPFLSGGGGIVGPGVAVKIETTGGATHECSEAGGDTIGFGTKIDLFGGTELASVQWSVDGKSVGTGEEITSHIPLGSHTVSVVATTATGESGSASAEVKVQDTIPPEVVAWFSDSRTGQQVTTVSADRRQFVQVGYSATDVCDPAPVTSATMTPASVVVSGDEFTVKPGRVESVTLPISAVELKVKGVDASGRTGNGSAVLVIE